MWPFPKKEIAPIVEPTKEELASVSEFLARNRLSTKIDDVMQKAVDAASNFQAYENLDDQGNFFGQEFNIRATAGRIKATFCREPWVFASANLLARSLSSVPFKVYNAATDEVDENHPLNKQLKASNPLQDNTTLHWVGNLDLVLGGNYFLVFNETYTQALQVPVDYVQIQLTDDKKAMKSIKLWDTQLSTFKREIDAKYVVHFKYPNPYSMFFGLSLFIAASRPILLDRHKAEFEMAFYLRGATNSGVIETTEDMSKSRLERLLLSFEQIFTGRRNWWRTIFLPKGSKWVSSGLTMNEMQHLESLKENRKTILAVLGIPPSQIGLTEDVNRSTSEEQKLVLWENTIKPLANFIASGWNNSYLVKVRYGGRVVVKPDFSEVSALKESLLSKGEQAKAVESYLTINEIRKDILGYNPLPLIDARGDKFVAEIKPAGVPGFAGQQLSVDPLGLAQPAMQTVAETVVVGSEEPAKQLPRTDLKSPAVISQERIETKLTGQYIHGYSDTIDMFFKYVEYALRNNEDVRKYMSAKKRELGKKYLSATEKTFADALSRGFSYANSQVKRMDVSKKNFGYLKATRFDDTDQQAIDALRAREEDGQRTQLAQRSVSRFVGILETRTDEVMGIIENGMAQGKTTEQVAASIRETYGEAYKNQAFTIARTEILTAVSQGVKWNHDVLKQVFSDVKKQWFHVATDDGSRENHIEFEDEGPVASGHKWGGNLSYPRDPGAPAEEVINCRCTMVSVVPEDAQSNADVILDNLG